MPTCGAAQITIVLRNATRHSRTAFYLAQTVRIDDQLGALLGGAYRMLGQSWVLGTHQGDG